MTAPATSLKEQFDRVRSAYPPEMSASLVLPLLQLVQQAQGYVTEQDAATVAEYAGVPRVQVLEALSWYTMLYREPVGRHVIKVCRNIACSLRGSERLLGHLERSLGIGVGETTADRRCTLLAVECLASCGTAPVMQVNDTHYEQLDEAAVDRILKDLA
ncbi:MAG TPA: NAD(P)H-dependent oxidoreductase subunit E [Burkholderiales bacterium]|nr:NAD(P)H-dependent oxidoreductase subunit E [Burkholderiales bacterium]